MYQKKNILITFILITISSSIKLNYYLLQDDYISEVQIENSNKTNIYNYNDPIDENYLKTIEKKKYFIYFRKKNKNKSH